jgi:hypothetical protein
MAKYLTPLKLKDYLTLIVLIILGFGWLLIDQIFLKETYQRFIAFFILMVILYYFQFAINRPIQVINYANTIALVTFSFVVIVSLIMHIIINKDFSYKSVLIWIISGLLPYLVGLVYLKVHKK